MKRSIALALALFSLLAAAPRPQFDATVRSQTIVAAEKALDGYVFASKVPSIDAALDANRSRLVAISDPDAFAQAVTKVLYAASHDKHLRLDYSSDALPPRMHDRKPSAAQLADEAAFFKFIDYGYDSSANLAGNIGYVDIGGFANYPWPKATYDSMMALVADSDALIVDLRNNHGGDPQAVNYLLAYFFAKPVEVTGFLWRKGDKTSAERMYTPANVGGPRYLSKPVYVLTSTRTISGGEQFCYDLQALHRATLVGATTAGGANIGGPVNLNDHFALFVPVGTAHNPYTGTNWEGTGVKPDVHVNADAALLTAYRLALERAADPFHGSAEIRSEVLKDPAKWLRRGLGGAGGP